MRIAAVLLAPLGATQGFGCPWHSLGNRSVSAVDDAQGWVLAPALYVIDRLTGQETRYELTRSPQALPVLHGADCRVVPPADDDLADTYRITCRQDGRESTIAHSCKGDDAATPRLYNVEDRRGLTVATVILGCERPPDAVDGRA